MDEQKSEIAQFVRDAITCVPPLEGTSLTVDEEGIYGTQINGETWWHVPVVPNSVPRRMYPLYEVFSEIEEVLQNERGMDILLFGGDIPGKMPPEPALT